MSEREDDAVALGEVSPLAGEEERVGHLADEQPQHVGVGGRVAPAGPGAHPLDRHGRLGAAARRQRGEEGRAGGRAGLLLPGARGRRDPAEQLDDRGDRDGQVAVRRADAPGTDGDGRDDDLVQPQGGEPRADPDHVGDRVKRPDLVEVHLVG